MNYLDDLPKRDSNHDTQEAAEIAFHSAIGSCEKFIVQREDRNDYGTDVQIEARNGISMTNIRIHVQLKGTKSTANSNGFITRKIARTNLNYLLAQPDSIYVCYHRPSERLLVRYADDVYREYEHRGKDWIHQDWITVKFTQLFDEKFQRCLNERVLAAGRSLKKRRLQYVTTPPEQIPVLVQQATESIEIPADATQAKEILTKLYESGNDIVLSKSFEQFSAVLGSLPGAMDLAYMAEINLGVNGEQFDKTRVRQGIDVLKEAMERGGFHAGSLHYCIGNGWLALGEYEKAQDAYHVALVHLNAPEVADISAQCCKNMGAALEKLDKGNAARTFYERALELNPSLSEAHFALALWHRRKGDDLSKALEHLDQVTRPKGPAIQFSSVHGWRIELLFKTGDIKGAFREVNSLLSVANQLDWIWPWCARQVANFGRVSVEAAQKALQFWRVFLCEYPEDHAAKKERFLCLLYMRVAEEPTEIDFDEFKQMAIQLIDNGAPDPTFLWDRVGHWAQADGNWIEAENWYRKAYDLQPEEYGYCLGTALNFLNRHSEALPILLRQAEECQPDAMTWFQVAVAREGVEDIEGSISAYQRALELDADYELAWFNLGGVYWNSEDIMRASEIWDEAMTRFPNHELARKLRRDLPFLFKMEDYNESEVTQA